MLDRKIALNSIISAGARIIGLALSLITIGFISRYLGQTGFGYYATIVAFLYFFTVLADLGIYSICLREISRPEADEKKIMSNAFTLRFFAGLITFGLAPLIILLFPYPGEVKLGVLIGSVSFWLLSNQQVLIGVFQKHLRMDKIALAELTGRLAQLGVVTFFIWQGMSILFIITALIVGSLINFGLTFFFVRKYIPISFQFDFVFWKNLLKKSLPLGIAIIFTAVYFKLDTIMLSLMKPAADVGIYNLSYKLLESILFFPTMFIGLIMPLMSKYAFSLREKFNQIIQESLNVLLIFVLPMIIGTLFLSDRIILLISGQDFILSAQVLNILIFAVGIIFFGVLFSNMIISLEKQKTLTYIYGFGLLINLVTNFIFIPKYTYYGAAWTTVLTELVVTFLMAFVLFRTLDKLPSFKYIFKYILAALIMALFLYYFINLPLFVLILLAVLVYFVSLSLFGGFSIKQVLTLIKKDV